ncbi:MAG TPA: DUF4258 domain-containing protein [Solirubrobacterales bacterium]|nr:DUF4258 domain-containing protein [Solirubrobacterales bacterium]
MAIERFLWTEHAERRLSQRAFSKAQVDEAIRDGHASRQINRGDADWRVYGTRSDGRRFAVIYDHPSLGDPTVARIVSVWALRD